MDMLEMCKFQRNPNFELYLQVRKWEEQAKNPELIVSQTCIERYFNKTEKLIGTY